MAAAITTRWFEHAVASSLRIRSPDHAASPDAGPIPRRTGYAQISAVDEQSETEEDVPYRTAVLVRDPIRRVCQRTDRIFRKDRAMHVTADVPTIADRRNSASREQLLRRVRAEFDEMPCLRLTCGQARRLFGLRADVCERVLGTLVAEHTLTCGPDQRYGVRDAIVLQGTVRRARLAPASKAS
jgi:hypothetical protein